MYSSTNPFRFTLVAAAITSALSAHAQEAQQPVKAEAAKTQPAAAGKMQQVEVVGNANSYDARRDDTATKIVVNHDEIVKYGDTNVMDVLKRVPGVTVTGSNGGRGGEIRMRGLGGGYTQILINGERAPAGFSMDSLAPDVIERIEVLRAATAEFSTQSVAGTINIILKKAIKTGQREVKAGYARGPGFMSPNVNLQMSDRADKLSWSVAANLFHQEVDRDAPTLEEGFDTSGRKVMQRNSNVHTVGRPTALSVTPRLSWNLGDGDSLTSQTFLNFARFSMNSHTAVDTVLGRAPAYPLLDGDMVNEVQFGRTELNWVNKLESGAKLDLKATASIGGLGNVQRRFGFASNGAPVLDSVVDSKGTDRSVTTTGKYISPLGSGHSLVFGWDGAFNNRDDSRVQTDKAIGGQPGYFSDEKFDGRVTRLAAFAQDEWNITQRWSVYLGMRWEGIRTRVEGNTFATAHNRSSVWSPLVQTLIKLPGTKSDQLRFAVTRTYKAQDLQTIIPRKFLSLNNSATQPDFQGNPNLKPELALGFDASYEHFFGEGAMVSVSTSMRRIQDFTRQIVSLQGDRWVAMASNEGTAITRGLELEAKFPLKAVMKDAPAIDLRASLSRNWSRVEEVPGPNNRLDQQTPVSATLGLDYKLGQLTTGGSYTFRNGGPVRVSLQQLSYQSVRRDLDVYALWKFNPKNQLRVAVSNVLGQDFISATSFTDRNGMTNATTTAPGNLVVRATMEMKF